MNSTEMPLASSRTPHDNRQRQYAIRMNRTNAQALSREYSVRPPLYCLHKAAKAIVQPSAGEVSTLSVSLFIILLTYGESPLCYIFRLRAKKNA